MSSIESTRPSPDETSSEFTPPAVGCCGGPAPAGADACCVRDADVKAAGGSGCGCGTTAPAPVAPVRTRSGCC
jgi:hypothetical protein